MMMRGKRENLQRKVELQPSSVAQEDGWPPSLSSYSHCAPSDGVRTKLASIGGTNRPAEGMTLVNQKRLSCPGVFRHESEMAKKKKNAAAVALGRLGGLKGGKARARKLTAEERRASARRAAAARWSRKNR